MIAMPNTHEHIAQMINKAFEKASQTYSSIHQSYQQEASVAPSNNHNDAHVAMSSMVPNTPEAPSTFELLSNLQNNSHQNEVQYDLDNTVEIGLTHLSNINTTQHISTQVAPDIHNTNTQHTSVKL